jgi:hypothetical protein
MRADLAGESGTGGFPWRRDDYGVRMITLPDEVDGRRVRIGCDVMDIEDVHDSLATFGDRLAQLVFVAVARRLPRHGRRSRALWRGRGGRAMTGSHGGGRA